MTARIRLLDTQHPRQQRHLPPALGIAAAVVVLAAGALIRFPAEEVREPGPPMHNPDPLVIGPPRTGG